MRFAETGAAKSTPRRFGSLWVLATVFLLGCLGSYWLGARRLPVVIGEAVQFRVTAPEGYLLQPSAVRQGFALSPDGSRLAFTAMNAQGRFTLWVQELAQLDPRPLPGAEGLLQRSSEGEVNAAVFGKRIHSIGERRHAMKDEPRGAAPYDDVTAFEAYPAGPFLALEAAE